MDLRKQKLIEYIENTFKGIARKYTGEPYFNHCLTVAEKAHSHNIPLGFEKGLSHDLYEDIEGIAPYQFIEKLISFGYTPVESSEISNSVLSVTKPPKSEIHQSRIDRSNTEADRLSKISSSDQDLKLCDIIANCTDVVYHDPEFARIQLIEKHHVINRMDQANGYLRSVAFKLIHDNLMVLDRIQQPNQSSDG